MSRDVGGGGEAGLAVVGADVLGARDVTVEGGVRRVAGVEAEGEAAAVGDATVLAALLRGEMDEKADAKKGTEPIL